LRGSPGNAPKSCTVSTSTSYLKLLAGLRHTNRISMPG
jgi:hypothetical protein